MSRRPRDDREDGGGHRLAYHTTQHPHTNKHSTLHLHHSTERNGSILSLATEAQVIPALSWSPLKGSSDTLPLHCPFLLISASAYLGRVQQGLKTDIYNAKGFTSVLVGRVLDHNHREAWVQVPINTSGDSSPSPIQERGQKEKQAQWLGSGAGPVRS